VPRRTWLDIKIDVFLEELAATVSAETEEMTRTTAAPTVQGNSSKPS
jgi:hypothetical protein